MRTEISTVARVLTYPPRLVVPGRCLFIGIVNDKGRYHSQRRKDYSDGARALLNPAHSWRTADPQQQIECGLFGTAN
jgi:hypothetical protein